MKSYRITKRGIAIATIALSMAIIPELKADYSDNFSTYPQGQPINSSGPWSGSTNWIVTTLDGQSVLQLTAGAGEQDLKYTGESFSGAGNGYTVQMRMRFDSGDTTNSQYSGFLVDAASSGPGAYNSRRFYFGSTGILDQGTLYTGWGSVTGTGISFQPGTWYYLRVRRFGENSYNNGGTLQVWASIYPITGLNPGTLIINATPPPDTDPQSSPLGSFWLHGVASGTDTMYVTDVWLSQGDNQPVNAAVIYQDNFTGSGNNTLIGTTPTVTTGGNSWVGTDPSFAANGQAVANAGAYLSFAPVAGHVYTLQGTLNPVSSGGDGWFAFGYTAGGLPFNGSPSWFLVKPSNIGGAVYSGKGDSLAALGNVTNSSNVFTIALNTTGINWVSTFSVNGTVLDTQTFTGGDPTISYIGIYANADSLATGSRIINCSLTVGANYTTNITFTVAGNTLNLTWPATHLGWLVQSNSVNLAIANAWHDIIGTDTATNFSVTINPIQTNVFYRLRSP